MEPAALIFDLDGTLWDSTKVVAEAWSECGKKYFGPDFSISQSAVKAQMGLMMEDIAKNIASSTPNLEKGKAWAEEAFDFEIEYLSSHPGDLFPKEEETLLELKRMGYTLLIMSNCQKGYIEDYLASLSHPEIFSGHLCYGDTHLPKNGSIRKLLNDFGIKKACYIGDTGSDEIQTRLAGLTFIHAGYGFGKAENPDYILKDFSDMVAAAKKVLPL